MNLTTLSNDELLSGLRSFVGQGRVVLARLLAYLGEVEDRRLDLEAACTSLYDFCVRRLGMGEDEACRRVAAARLVRRFPIALGMIERGEIHMTSLLLLREHLTDDNHEELLHAARGMGKSAVQHLIATRFPRPDAPSRILPLSPAAAAQSRDGSPAGEPPTRPNGPVVPPRVEPLSAERYKVQFTASAELRQKLERAADLMRHSNPNGDVAVVVERALDLLIERLEKRRLGKTSQERKLAPKSKRPGYVPRAVRREVFERDGERCTFVDEHGCRCEARTWLELDHIVPRALGGTDDAKNLRVRCRAHNQLTAERELGRARIEAKRKSKKIHPRQRGRVEGHAPEHGMALSALCGLGFKAPEVRRALATLESRWTEGRPPMEQILRDAITLLT